MSLFDQLKGLVTPGASRKSASELSPSGFDVIVIGAGHNGLVCAGYLANAGRRVLVLEAGRVPGGSAQSGDIGGETYSSRCAHIVRDFDDNIISDLRLKKHGLSFAAQSLPTYALDYDGAHIMLTHNLFQAADTIKVHSERDAERYPDFVKQIQRFASVAKAWDGQIPGRMRGIYEEGRAEDLSADARAIRQMGSAFERLSKTDRKEFFRYIVSSVGDHLDRSFESDLLKGAIAFDGVLGQNAGAYSPGTAWSLAKTWRGEVAGRKTGISVPEGGMGKIIDALVGSLSEKGGQVRNSSPVARILVDHGRTVGVELVSGERIFAPQVVSATDPKTTLLELLGREYMETDLASNVEAISQVGVGAKINLLLDRMPRIVGFDYMKNPPARYLIAPSLDYIEAAYNPSKYGELSAQPIMEITFPTQSDETLVARNEQIMSIVVQYTPYDVFGGWDDARERFISQCLDVLGNYMSDIREHLVGGEFLTPVDLEEQFNLKGGHWHHGDLDPGSQLMMRPAPGIAQHLGPVKGLYLCGAGCHPGGGVLGLSGQNAARRMLKDETEPLHTIRPAHAEEEEGSDD